jgi:hypothetical protein
MNVKKPQPIVEDITQIVGNWLTYAAKQKVPDSLAKGINKTLLV